MLSVAINILLTIHVIVSLFIVLIVLMQRPKNEGLGAAFGGGMTDNLFGAQTTNVLQTITRWLGGIFFALTLSLSFLYVKQTADRNRSAVQKKLAEAPAVVPATPAPAPDVPGAASAPVQVGDATPAPTPAAPASADGIKLETPAPAPAPMLPPVPPIADPATPAPAPGDAVKPVPAAPEPLPPADAAKPVPSPAPAAPPAAPSEKPAEKPQ